MISDSAKRLKDRIEKAIDDGIITPEEYDQIIHIASEDNVIDRHEQALLQQLQEMLADKSVRFGKK